MTRRKTTLSRRGGAALEKLIEQRYGLDPERADPAVVVRAAEWLMWTAGARAADLELKELNKRRVAAEQPLVKAPPGHALAWNGKRT